MLNFVNSRQFIWSHWFSQSHSKYQVNSLSLSSDCVILTPSCRYNLRFYCYKYIFFELLNFAYSGCYYTNLSSWSLQGIDCDSISWDWLSGNHHPVGRRAFTLFGTMSLLSLVMHYGTLFEGCTLTTEDFWGFMGFNILSWEHFCGWKQKM